VRVLLDTQSWLWMQASPDRFSADARAVIQDSGNSLYFSAASAWEIAIKYALGNLPLPVPPAEYVPSRMVSSGVIALLICHAHALRVSILPHHHRDPFDRVLTAQAQIEGLKVLTSDPQFSSYDVSIIWANR
jgi:PIN domain nuclease of toxin-antitoxin system